MDYFEAKQKYNLSPFGDIDKDKVKNIFDCKPYDPKRDGILGRAANVISGGRYGQSSDEYEAEKRNRPLIREQRRVERRKSRAEEREAYREEFKKARIERAKQRGKQAGSTSIADRFNTAAKNIQFKPYSTRNNYNPWGSTFDRGMSRPKKSSSSKTKYKVIGGKAYPIAGNKPKKKKKSSNYMNFDMTDNWGFMR